MKQPLALANTGNKPSTTRARAIARWRAAFLKALRETPSVKHACLAAGIDRSTAYRHRQEDEDFAAQWLDAIQGSVDQLEAKAFAMALAGDSNLITFLLRCHKPEIYNPSTKVDAALLGGIVYLPQKSEGAE
jgi:hypothetical protein